ncbi:RDD family protein [Pseudoflavitalea sp. G-6-1-2]|uniref:RDD family protein n=1 Tax=Pseudoflavitalea sp. G-6-1-2 TaxID=2728841 RepID=UPI00146C2E3B|nr:RDD family protein [Pseudoflavitalea sp. G-6-1-2]NML19816.1 RDD family protein [Pseudoflavitalea sp. G-6-1-2]
MKKSALIIVILIAVFQILATALFNFRQEKFILEVLTGNLYDYKDILRSSKLFCYELLKIFYIVATIMLLTSNGERRDKIYALIRYVFMMHMLINIPATIRFYLEVGIMSKDTRWYYLIIHQAFTITALVVLWKNKPQNAVPSINLSEYSLVSYTNRGHRLLNHVADYALFLIIGYTYVDTSRSYYNPGPILVDYLMNFIAWFLYYFLSEAIFRQTFGKMLTRSCVVAIDAPMTTGRALTRTLGRLIPFEAFSFLFNANWHDKVSGTTVVYQNTWEDPLFEDERQ